MIFSRHRLESGLGQLLRKLINILVLDLDNGLFLGLLGLLDELLCPLIDILLLRLLLFLFLLVGVLLLEVAQAVKTPLVLSDNIATELLLALLKKILESNDGLVILGELVAVELDLLQSRESLLSGLSKTLDTGGGNLVVLKAQDLELLVFALEKRLREENTALGREERVADAKLNELSPAGGHLRKSLSSLEGKSVVLEVENLELGSVVETLAQQVGDTLLANTVLDHLDLLNLIVQTESLGPRRHTAVLKAVTAADDGLEVRNILSLLARFLLLGVEFRQSIGDQDTGVGTEAVVVEVQVLERDVGGEEGDKGSLGVEAESVVVEVYRVQLGEVEDGGKEGGKSLGDLVEQTTGKDIGEVGNLNR